jgi:DNA-binding NarL/FixJ family response regulator
MFFSLTSTCPQKKWVCRIRSNKARELLNLPVIVLSTANDEAKVKMVFKDAAHYYIRKPAKFIELKEVLYKTIKLIAEGNLDLPKQENFLITVEAKSKLDEVTHPKATPVEKLIKSENLFPVVGVVLQQVA